MEWLKRLFSGSTDDNRPINLRHGDLGERAARRHLEKSGLQFIMANFRSGRGEIDLVFQGEECLIFVEVKTRSSEQWSRPSKAVDADKRRLFSACALDYLRQINNPEIKIRFDIVEVLLEQSYVVE